MNHWSVLSRFKIWLDSSIQRKLVIWSIAFWVISLSVLSLMLFIIGQSQILAQTRARNVQIASVFSRDINAQIGDVITDSRVYAKRLEATPPDLENQTVALLALRLSSPQRYSALYYFDARGKLLVYINDPLDTLLNKKAADLINRPSEIVYKQLTQQGVVDLLQSSRGIDTKLSEVHYNGMDDIPVTYLAAPINVPGSETRIVIFEIDLRNIWQLIDLSTVGQSGYIYTVSREGVIIAHPAPASLGRQIPVELQPLLQGYEGFTEYLEPSNNREVLAAYSPVGGATGWGIVVVQDKVEANAPVLRTGILITSIWAILALIGIFSILIVIRNFTRPIVQLTRTTKEIARTGDLTKTASVHRPDEVGQLSQAFDQMIERLEKSEVRLAHVAAEERSRLARDLHDAVSQTLFSASLIAEVLPKLWDRNPAEGKKRLEEVRQLARGALAEMRTLLLELRPSALIEADINHLLNQLAESITGRSRIPVIVSFEGDCNVPTDVKIALYRVAQEALNNVAKHSGANQAVIVLNCDDKKVALTIKDDGHGFDVQALANKSLGMGIIRERSKEINAELTIESLAGFGTSITVVWHNPVPRPECEKPQ
jgi:signal transduction histidine kinase